MKYSITDFTSTSDIFNAPEYLIESAGDITIHVRNFVTQGEAYFELNSSDDDMLTVGVNHRAGFIQFSSKDREPPYLCARSNQRVYPGAPDYLEFNIGRTSTPIPIAYCLAFTELEKILIEYCSTNHLSKEFVWEEI